MATVEEMQAAMVKAYDAGRTDDAKTLALAIRQAQSAQPEPLGAAVAPQAMPSAGMEAAPPSMAIPEPSMMDQLGRALGLGVRDVAQGVVGVPALFTDPIVKMLPGGNATARESVDYLADMLGLPKPESTSERIGGAITEAIVPGAGMLKAWQYMSQAPGLIGNVSTELARLPGRGLAADALAGGAPQVVDEMGGGPWLQLAAALAAGSIPSLFRTPMTGAADDALMTAERLGVDLGAMPGAQVEQIKGAASRLGSDELGAAMPVVRSELRAAKAAAAKEARGLYETARTMPAAVKAGEAAAFSRAVASDLAEKGFDVQMMPNASKRLNELATLEALPDGSKVKIEALELWRKRVSKMAAKNDPTERAAAGILSRSYDDFMTNQFNRDMVSGDKAAVKAWQDARESWSDFKRTFDADKVVKNLADKSTTPEQMRQWVFNANAVGAKKESAKVVAGLRKILGDDSNAIKALRSEVFFDIAEPALRREPDLKAFADNLDKFQRNNPSLVKELFPSGMGDMSSLSQFARAISDREGAIPKKDAQTLAMKVWNRATAYLAGHGLAAGQARLSSIREIPIAAWNWAMSGNAKRRMLHEYLGTSPMEPMANMAPAVAVGAAGVEGETE